jgi:hypothetical protein
MAHRSLTVSEPVTERLRGVRTQRNRRSLISELDDSCCQSVSGLEVGSHVAPRDWARVSKASDSLEVSQCTKTQSAVRPDFSQPDLPESSVWDCGSFPEEGRGERRTHERKLADSCVWPIDGLKSHPRCTTSGWLCRSRPPDFSELSE